MANTPLELGNRKLVVLGIPYNVDTDGLRQYMSKYGSLDDVVVMKDRKGGGSRGFGYVTFSSAESAEKALASKHILHERLVEVKVATPKEEMKGPAKKITRIFVARIPHKVSEEEFKEYFAKFGVITDLFMPKDKGAKTHRGIGFITFESPDSVAKVMAGTHELGGATIAVDEASPKEEGGKAFNAKNNYPSKSSYSDRERDYCGAHGSYSPYMATKYSMRSSYVDRERDYHGAYRSYSPYMRSSGNAPKRSAYDFSSFGADHYPDSRSYNDYGSIGPGGREYGGSSWAGHVQSSGGSFSSYPSSHRSAGPEPLANSGIRNRVIVGRLPPEATSEDLRRYFGNYGHIVDVYLPENSGRHRGFALVTFSDPGSAEYVCQRPHELLGCQIIVEQDANNSHADVYYGGEPGIYGKASSTRSFGSNTRINLDHYDAWGGASNGVGPMEGVDRFARADARYRPY